MFDFSVQFMLASIKDRVPPVDQNFSALFRSSCSKAEVMRSISRFDSPKSAATFSHCFAAVTMSFTVSIAFSFEILKSLAISQRGHLPRPARCVQSLLCYSPLPPSFVLLGMRTRLGSLSSSNCRPVKS